MKNMKTAVGASALLAAGLVGITAPAANASPRISADQLSASISHAVALEQQSPTTVGTHPAGRAAQVEVRNAFCSAE